MAESAAPTSDINRFGRPIPGMGLTDKLGSHPWQKPPRFVHLDEALEFVWERLTQPPSVGQVLALLSHGELSAQDIADTILFQGFTSGLWTVTLASLMLRPVWVMVAAIGHKAGIKFKTKTAKVDPLTELMTNIKLGEQTGLDISASGDDPPGQPPAQTAAPGAPAQGDQPPPAGGMAGMAGMAGATPPQASPMPPAGGGFAGPPSAQPAQGAQ